MNANEGQGDMFAYLMVHEDSYVMVKEKRGVMLHNKLLIYKGLNQVSVCGIWRHSILSLKKECCNVCMWDSNYLLRAVV